MLRPMRDEWETAFAASGREALEMLEANDFDVVVSDMRMPGMDGSELLGTIAQRYPNIIRLILSGYSEQDSVVRSIGTAHQHLSKPCDRDELKTTIERACALRGLLTNDRLRQLVNGMNALPSLPSLYLELQQELSLPNVSLKKIGAIVAKDPAMTAKLLQIVNSAYFGLRRRLSNAEDAVQLLGVDMIASLALSIKVFSQFQIKKTIGFSLETFWAHSLSVGKFAQWIIRNENGKTSEAGLTAGLLHDIGKLVLVSSMPDEYDRVVQRAFIEDLPQIALEQEVFGATHPEIGGYLLGLWCLPQPIVEAVVFHHEPNLCPVSEFGTLTAVHVANTLDNEMSAGITSAEHSLNRKYLRDLKISHKINFWRDAYQKQHGIEVK